METHDKTVPHLIPGDERLIDVSHENRELPVGHGHDTFTLVGISPALGLAINERDIRLEQLKNAFHIFL